MGERKGKWKPTNATSSSPLWKLQLPAIAIGDRREAGDQCRLRTYQLVSASLLRCALRTNSGTHHVILTVGTSDAICARNSRKRRRHLSLCLYTSGIRTDNTTSRLYLSTVLRCLPLPSDFEPSLREAASPACLFSVSVLPFLVLYPQRVSKACVEMKT